MKVSLSAGLTVTFLAGSVVASSGHGHSDGVRLHKFVRRQNAANDTLPTTAKTGKGAKSNVAGSAVANAAAASAVTSNAAAAAAPTSATNNAAPAAATTSAVDDQTSTQQQDTTSATQPDATTSAQVQTPATTSSVEAPAATWATTTAADNILSSVVDGASSITSAVDSAASVASTGVDSALSTVSSGINSALSSGLITASSGSGSAASSASITSAASAASKTSSAKTSSTMDPAAASASASAAAVAHTEKVATIKKGVIIAIAAIAGSVAGVYLIWTVVRKTVFKPSRQFNDRMNAPSEFSGHQPGDRDSWNGSDVILQHERNMSAMGGGGMYAPSVARSNSDAKYSVRHSVSDYGHGGYAPSIAYNGPTSAYTGAGLYSSPSMSGYSREPANMGYSDLQRGNSTNLVASSLQRAPTGLSAGAGIDRSFTASPYNYEAHAAAQAQGRY